MAILGRQQVIVKVGEIDELIAPVGVRFGGPNTIFGQLRHVRLVGQVRGDVVAVLVGKFQKSRGNGVKQVVGKDVIGQIAAGLGLIALIDGLQQPLF